MEIGQFQQAGVYMGISSNVIVTTQVQEPVVTTIVWSFDI